MLWKASTNRDYSRYIGKGLKERDDEGKWRYIGSVVGHEAQFLITKEGNFVDVGALEETVIATNFRIPPRVRLTSPAKFTLNFKFPFVHYEYKKIEKSSKEGSFTRRSR